MHVHEVRFCSRAALGRALSRLVDCPHVEGCVVDRDGLEIAFRAPAERAAELMERLHQRGELTAWRFREPSLAS
jgi:hypothetical protein